MVLFSKFSSVLEIMPLARSSICNCGERKGLDRSGWMMINHLLVSCVDLDWFSISESNVDKSSVIEEGI